MSNGDLQPLGVFKKSWTFWDVLRLGGLLFLSWQVINFILKDLPNMLTSANGPQLVTATVLAIAIGAFLIYVRTADELTPKGRGVFLDGTDVVVRASTSETRIPLGTATVRYSTSTTGSEEYIDGEHRAIVHHLRIDGGQTSATLDITGMTPANIRNYRDQLQRDLADARWRYRLPEPGPESEFR